MTDSDNDQMGPGWAGATWTVTILRGAPLDDDTVRAPLVFGTPSITLGDGPLEVREPIAYGPVHLIGDQYQLAIQVPVEITRAEVEQALEERGSVQVGYQDVRIMADPRWEFQHNGTIFVAGWEIDRNDRPLRATWDIEPYEAAALPTTDQEPPPC